jgi:peptidoglycan/xylan/chitin deacetylase (PgdA/CDA1 family)
MSGPDMRRLNSALIVNYHYCAPAEEALPGFKGITAHALDSQLTTLKETCEPVMPDDIPLAAGWSCERVGYLVTFDDGLRSVFYHAVPLLRKHSAPAIIFCCAQPYVEKRVLNVQKTHLLQGRWGWDGFEKRLMTALADDEEAQARDDTSRLGLDQMYRYDDPDTARFKRLINVELPYRVISRVLDTLFEAEFGPQQEAVRYLYMSLDEIRRCADDGIRIGLHTHSHCMLSRLAPEEQAQELGAAQFFRENADLEIETLSYPYGIRGSWNEDTKRIATAQGLHAAFTLDRALYDPVAHVDPFEIPRYDVNDVFARDNALKLFM